MQEENMNVALGEEGKGGGGVREMVVTRDANSDIDSLGRGDDPKRIRGNKKETGGLLLSSSVVVKGKDNGHDRSPVHDDSSGYNGGEGDKDSDSSRGRGHLDNGEQTVSAPDNNSYLSSNNDNNIHNIYVSQHACSTKGSSSSSHNTKEGRTIRKESSSPRTHKGFHCPPIEREPSTQRPLHAKQQTLIHCASSGNLQALKQELQGLNPEEARSRLEGATDCDGQTALHRAAAGGQEEVVRYLLESAGVDARAKDKDGSTALHLARDGSQEIKRMIERHVQRQEEEERCGERKRRGEQDEGGGKEGGRSLVGAASLSRLYYYPRWRDGEEDRDTSEGNSSIHSYNIWEDHSS